MTERIQRVPTKEFAGRTGIRLKPHTPLQISKGISLEDFSIFPQTQRQREPLEEKWPSAMENLANGVVRLINICIANNVGAVVFTERSGIPMGDLFRIAWERLQSGIEPPQIGSINIGRIKDGTNDDTLPSPRTSEIEDLRKRHGFNLKEGQSVLGVDEFVDTGKTIKHTLYLLREIYPDTRVFVSGALDTFAPWGKGRIQTGLSESAYPGNRFVSGELTAMELSQAQEVRNKRNAAFSKLADNILNLAEYLPIEQLREETKPKLPKQLSDLIDL